MKSVPISPHCCGSTALTVLIETRRIGNRKEAVANEAMGSWPLDSVAPRSTRDWGSRRHRDTVSPAQTRWSACHRHTLLRYIVREVTSQLESLRRRTTPPREIFQIFCYLVTLPSPWYPRLRCSTPNLVSCRPVPCHDKRKQLPRDQPGS